MVINCGLNYSVIPDNREGQSEECGRLLASPEKTDCVGKIFCFSFNHIEVSRVDTFSKSCLRLSSSKGRAPTWSKW